MKANKVRVVGTCQPERKLKKTALVVLRQFWGWPYRSKMIQCQKYKVSAKGEGPALNKNYCQRALWVCFLIPKIRRGSWRPSKKKSMHAIIVCFMFQLTPNMRPPLHVINLLPPFSKSWYTIFLYLTSKVTWHQRFVQDLIQCKLIFC